jgi:hypothetical protein
MDSEYMPGILTHGTGAGTTNVETVEKITNKVGG